MSFAFKKFTGRMNSSRLIRFLSLNSDSLAKKKKNRKKEETPCLSCKKKGDSKDGNNSEKKCFFEKKGEYVKRRKAKRQRKVNQIQGNLQKRDTFKKDN